MTIDFSARLESGVNEVFPDVIVQKCVFHAIQLLTRGLIKEFTRVKKKYLLEHVEEWKALRTLTLLLEKNKHVREIPPFKFDDVAFAWQVYNSLKSILSCKNPTRIERELHSFFLSTPFITWKGKHVLLSKYEVIFTKKKFKFSRKAMKYVVPMIYKAFRAAMRDLRTQLEESKARFNKARYLVLMNPVNMKPYHRTKLRKYLKEFPWLRSYRELLARFYYQFRRPPTKRSPLTFLLRLISDTSHPWLINAVHTLLENEEKVFRFQHVPELFPKTKTSKSIKVVNESCNKLARQLYRTQCGMRTIKNIRMRISNRLKCPIIISPNLLEKIK
jgi:hypothetical protein